MQPTTDDLLKRARRISNDPDLYVPPFKYTRVRKFTQPIDHEHLTLGASYNCLDSLPMRELLFEWNFFPWPTPPHMRLPVIGNVITEVPFNFHAFVDFRQPQRAYITSKYASRNDIYAYFEFTPAGVELVELI